MVYSLLGSCKLHGINAHEYLQDVLQRCQTSLSTNSKNYFALLEKVEYTAYAGSMTCYFNERIHFSWHTWTILARSSDPVNVVTVKNSGAVTGLPPPPLGFG
jgi:hypothetical protein